jgi:plastocyanin
MHRIFMGLGIVAGLLASPVPRAEAQEIHVVRLMADPAKDVFRFEPASITVKPNDVVVFRVTSGAPHSIVFEGGELSPGVRGAFNSALVGRSGDLSSPLLTASGKDYRMVVPQVPAGRYRFYCLPHRAYDMRGELVIQ